VAQPSNPDGFVVNRRKPRGLSAAFTPIPLMTWPPRHPGSALVFMLNQETVHDFILLFLPPCGRPPGPSSRAYLSLHCSEATQAKTLRTRSSPTPTQIKPRPAPAILGQESVHTTLTVTHHTKERPSTDPQTLRTSSADRWSDGMGKSNCRRHAPGKHFAFW
jgi:hypothetical protein